jgi:RHH-type proline utilization regulon transcriptional repressor/proline dehydrogenase/delta 1-pyrroline-5-carboxylate dehydrogenase
VAVSTPADQQILDVGRRLLDALHARSRRPLRAVDERAIDLTSRDPELRAAMLRLVDVAPGCRSPEDLAAHLVGFLDEVEHRPAALSLAVRMGDTRAGRAALGAAVAAGVRHVAHRFIAAETPARAQGLLRSLWERDIATSVDLLGEATVSAEEADRYARRCAEALGELARCYAELPARARLQRDSLGSIPRANLSVKVSGLTPLLRPQAPELGVEDAARRLRPLLRTARDLGAHLHVDMESYDSRETVARLVLDLLEEEEFREGPSCGVVIQAYLTDSFALAERILAWAQTSGRAQPLVVRLVKGAYWDHEVVDAAQHGWTPPVYSEKAASDRNFEALTRRLLAARPHVRPAIATHNLRSVAHAIVANEAAGGAPGDVEFQVLYGLGDELMAALASEGFRVRAYCPVGDLVAGMAYLVRRLLENTANEGFLRLQADGRPAEELLAAP